jgi:Cu-Zn family superoxide dismutase
MAVDKATFELSPPARKAVCILASSDKVTGNLVFVENGNGVTQVTGTIKGLDTGDHGFHVHEFGDYTAGNIFHYIHFIVSPVH